MSEPILTRQDRDSVAWLKIKVYLEARLAKKRIENDNDMDERARARLGGRIAEIKALLALDQDAPPVPPDQDKFKNLD